MRIRVLLPILILMVLFCGGLGVAVYSNIASATDNLIQKQLNDRLTTVINRMLAAQQGGINLTTAQMQEIIGTMSMREGGILVAGSDGIVIADYRNTMTGSNIAGNDWFNEAFETVSTSLSITLGNTEVTAQTAVVDKKLVVSYLPNQTIEDLTITPIYVIGVVGLIGIVLMGILSYLIITRFLINPLESLSEQIKDFAKGKPIYLKPLSGSPEAVGAAKRLNSLLEHSLSDEPTKLLPEHKPSGDTEDTEDEPKRAAPDTEAVAVAEPAPAPAPEPAPAPAFAPEPEHVSKPEPAPAPEPAPEPAPKPAVKPAPAPEPASASKPAPAPAPEPAPAPQPAQAPAPAPAPAPQPAPQPRPQPAPQPVPQPAPQPAPIPVPVPVAAPVVAPAVAATPAPATEVPTKPVIDLYAEQTIELDTDPVFDLYAKPEAAAVIESPPTTNFDFTKLLRDAFEKNRGLANSKRIKFALLFSNEVPKVINAHENEIARQLTSAFSEAFQAANPGSEVNAEILLVPTTQKTGHDITIGLDFYYNGQQRRTILEAKRDGAQ